MSDVSYERARQMTGRRVVTAWCNLCGIAVAECVRGGQPKWLLLTEPNAPVMDRCKEIVDEEEIG